MELIQCPACKTEVYQQDNLCENCKFPFMGSEKEKSIHIGRFISKKGVVQDSSNATTNVQKILYALSALYVISIVIIFSSPDSHWLDMVFNAFLAVIFLLSAILVKKAPVFFTAFPLAVLLGVYTLLAVIDPVSLINGVIIKLLIVGSLVYSLYLLYKSKQFKKRYRVS
tara:strand:+ start:6522 stop:7028 length:507 start_codon:yes stop_codon:yes gene_type:complete